MTRPREQHRPESVGQRRASFLLRSAFCLLHFAFGAFASAAEAPEAIPVDGSPFVGRPTAIDKQRQLTFHTDAGQRMLSANDLVLWGQCHEQGRAAGIVLIDGGFLVAEVTAIDGREIAARSAAFGSIRLPRTAVAGIVCNPPLSIDEADRSRDKMLSEARSGDRLLLENGDTLAGLIRKLTDDSVHLESDVGPIDVPLDRIKAIVFDPTQRHNATANAIRAWVGFSDGTRLIADQLLIGGDSLAVTTIVASLHTKPAELVFVQPLGGRTVYLSDLMPRAERQTPYLDVPWPSRVTDRNVSGGMLRSGGRLYLKGLGVHSHATQTYSLPSGVTRFDAEVAIDDSTAGRGSVVFRVLVDGHERFASGIIRGGDKPVPISVDVRGGQNLELIVDYADRADVLDRANWLNARLTR